jgi:hypothetical protein
MTCASRIGHGAGPLVPHMAEVRHHDGPSTASFQESSAG